MTKGEYPIHIETHNGIHVLRDDRLPGGTKSVLIQHIVDKHPGVDEFVYASPVYGGFQIALSMYCHQHGKQATIFCAKRKHKHPNTKRCIQNGAKIVEVPNGYLSVVEKHAKDYVAENAKRWKIEFGAQSPDNIDIITKRAKRVIRKLGREPDEIWVAVGSGTIVQGILGAIKRAKVYGVQVGAKVDIKHPQLTLYEYPHPFERESVLWTEFPSMANYDKKAFEMCLEKHKKGHMVLFWNVL
jgi:hypothetical protein